MNNRVINFGPVRRRIGSHVCAALVLLLAPVSMLACDSTAEPRPQALSATVEQLAADRFDGRLTGSPGNRDAARMLAERLAGAGARPLPGENDLLVRHEQPVIRQLEPPTVSVTAPGGASVSFEPGVDFSVLIREGASPAGPVDADLLVLGEERANPAWIASHAGAALLVDADTFSTISRDAAVMEALFAAQSGPAAIVLALPPQVESMPRSLYLTGDTYPTRGPVLIQMTHRAAGRLPVAGDGGRSGASDTAGDAPATISLRGGYTAERATVASVAALVHDGRGSGEAAPPLVVSAHFDGPGRVTDEWHYPGAVDNASGVAVALEVARLIAEGACAPDRPVWIVLFNGEEQGMHGSRAFVRAFSDRLRGARVINVDMVGRRTTPVTVTVNPDASELGELAGRHIRAHGLEATVREGAGSDHAAFRGVAPAVSLVQAPYERMHRRGDVPANAEADVLAQIVASVCDVIASPDVGEKQ